MKKLTLGLAVLLSGVAANSFAYFYNGASKYGVCVPNFCGGWSFGLTGLSWRPSTSQLDHGLTYGDASSVFDFGDGRYHSVDVDSDWGFRVNVGYVFPCSANALSLSWTHYDHNDSEHIKNPGLLLATVSSSLNPASPFAGFLPPFTPAEITPIIAVTGTVGGIPVVGALAPTFTLPLTAATLDLASAKADFKNDAFDLDVGQSVNVGCNLHVHWFGGLRYSRVETKFNAIYEAESASPFSVGRQTVLLSPPPSPIVLGIAGISASFDVLASIREVVNQKSDFEGIGPRLGVDANYELCGGFGIVSEISTSLLFGEIKSTLFDRIEDTTSATLTSATLLDASGGLIDVAVAGVPLGPIGTSTPIGAVFTSTNAAELSFKHPDETRVVPNIDAKIGLDYTFAFCNPSHSKLVIEGGWMMSYYFNAIDRLSQVQSVGPEFRTRHSLDASFDGPYVRLQFNV